MFRCVDVETTDMEDLTALPAYPEEERASF